MLIHRQDTQQRHDLPERGRGIPRLLMALTDDGIDLPVPESTATVHHDRAVLNGNAFRQVLPTTVGTIPLPPGR